MTRPATIEDVAQAAGVSAATVSRALRGLPNVAPSTRALVQQTAARMRYQTDPRASALASGRNKTIAIAVPVLASWYFSQVMSGAEAVLRDAGYTTLLLTTDAGDRLSAVLAGPLVKRADGLILIDVPTTEVERRALDDADVQVVTVGMELDGVTCVVVDDRQLAYDAVGHLIELGHRRIGLIHGLTHDPQDFSVPRERRRGYDQALADARLDPSDELTAGGNFSVQGGYEAMGRLLDVGDPPTAVFAMSDEMAFGALQALRERGLVMPGDVSVVGVDDHDVAAVVGLTTVKQEVSDHGAVAARLMLRRLAGASDNDDDPVRHVSPHRLIVRTSTGPRPR